MKYHIHSLFALALGTLFLVALPAPSYAGLARVDDPPEYYYRAENGACIGLPERIDPNEISLGADCTHLKGVLVKKIFASHFQNGSDLEAEPIVEVELHIHVRGQAKKLYYTKYQGGFPPFLTYDDSLFSPYDKTAGNVEK